MIMVRAADEHAFLQQAFMHVGVSKEHASIAAHCLCQADLRGVQTHGMTRVPIYVERLHKGWLNKAPNLQENKVSDVCVQLDGDNGLGFVVANHAMSCGIKMAQDYGIGLVGVHHSNHFGMAASYLLQAVEAGMIAFVFTNASPAMPPWGGKSPFLGTSPFAVAAPSGQEVPFLLDMSPAVAARGKIRLAEKRGESIPLGYALDADGQPTTDPTAALAGVVLPIGGPKGSGISMLMDILAGVFTGAAFAGDVKDQYKAQQNEANVGHFMLVMRPGLLISQEAFLERMDILVKRIKANPKAKDVEEIYMPGEHEARLCQERLEHGIPFTTQDLDLMDSFADSYGLPHLVRADC